MRILNQRCSVSSIQHAINRFIHSITALDSNILQIIALIEYFVYRRSNRSYRSGNHNTFQTGLRKSTVSNRYKTFRNRNRLQILAGHKRIGTNRCYIRFNNDTLDVSLLIYPWHGFSGIIFHSTLTGNS